MKCQKETNICITIDSVMRIENENYQQVFLEESKYRVKETNMTKFVEAELKSESKSESELESDIQVELRSELEPDTE